MAPAFLAKEISDWLLSAVVVYSHRYRMKSRYLPLYSITTFGVFLIQEARPLQFLIYHSLLKVEENDIEVYFFGVRTVNSTK